MCGSNPLNVGDKAIESKDTVSVKPTLKKEEVMSSSTDYTTDVPTSSIALLDKSNIINKIHIPCVDNHSTCKAWAKSGKLVNYCQSVTWYFCLNNAAVYVKIIEMFWHI